MVFATIYQAVPEGVLLILGEKDSTKTAWEALQTMHVGVERVKEEKAQTLKSEFEAICMKYGESIDDFAMKEANLTLMQDLEPTLMLAKKMPNLLTINEEKVRAKLLTKEEDRVETNMWYLDNGANNHMIKD